MGYDLYGGLVMKKWLRVIHAIIFIIGFSIMMWILGMMVRISALKGM